MHRAFVLHLYSNTYYLLFLLEDFQTRTVKVSEDILLIKYHLVYHATAPILKYHLGYYVTAPILKSNCIIVFIF
jgi:hypothetical protein